MNVALIYLHALKGGGYPRDVRWLAGALATRCDNVWLITSGGEEIDGLGGVHVIRPHEMRQIRARIDVTHGFGIFLPLQLVIQRRLPSLASVISPLGHLMEAHVARGAWKKRPYLLAARRLLIPRRPTFHIFSEAERPGIALYLPPAPSFCGNLGVFPTPPEAAVESTGSANYLLFFGRNDVHHKGIDVVLEGYALAARRGLSLRLVVAGAPHGGSDHIIRTMIERLGLTGSVDLLGRISKARKWSLLRRARALVFLSRWDGPPRPIREALAVGTPVIVSPGTNLFELVTREGAGRGVALDPEAVADAMLSAADEAEVAAWRGGAINLRDALSWERVAEQYLTGYERAVNAREEANFHTRKMG